MMTSTDPPALDFPQHCHVKVVAEDTDEMLSRLEAVLLRIDIRETISPGQASSGGRYRTYNLSLEVASLEQMRLIDSELRAVEGVRLVL